VNTGSTSILYIYGDISVEDTLFFGNGEWMEGETDTEIHTNASFEPETDLSHDLGEPTKRWNGVYTNDNYVYNNEYLDDTLFFAYDSTYIVDDTDTLKFVVDDDEAMRIINEGTNASVNVYGDLDVSGVLDVDSAVSIGAWGYTGEHIVFSEASSNTNPLLGVFGEANFDVSAGKTIAGTYSRALASSNQTNQSTIVGTESQFRLRNVNIADGVHAGLWAYAEQSGTSTLSGNGTFDAISACVESESGFTVGATEHVTGITIDASIHASASINASANYSGLYIKSNGKDWFDGIKITGCDNDIKLKNGATINNIRSGNLTITEDTVAVVGVLDVTGNAEVSGALTATGNITGATMVCLHTVATYVFSDLDSCKNVAHFNNDADAIDFTLPGAAAGLVVIFYDIGGGVITIDPVDGTDTIYLNGTSVGAGDAIDSPGDVGDFICLMAIDATRWVTVGRSGTWIDGGVD